MHTLCRDNTFKNGFRFFLFFIFLFNFSWAVDASRPNKHGPTLVQIRMFLIDIDDVKASEQKFAANIFYEAFWNDPRLAHKEDNLKIYFLNEIWNPRLQLANQQRIWLTMPKIVTVDKKGNVVYRQRVWGYFSQPLELHEFPFDKQIFSVKLIASGFTTKEVEMVIHPFLLSGMADEFSLPDWTILNWSIDDGIYRFTSKAPGIPTISFNVLAKRDIGYYILMYIIPLVLIIFMSWLAFWINIMETNTRISIAVTSMLTLIAYRFIMGSNLPKVSYLTQFDFINLAATFLVFITLLLTAIISLFIYHQHEKAAKTINKYSMISLPIVFLFLMLILFNHF